MYIICIYIYIYILLSIPCGGVLGLRVVDLLGPAALDVRHHLYIYIYTHTHNRGRRLHTRNQPQKSSRIFSGMFPSL